MTSKGLWAHYILNGETQMRSFSIHDFDGKKITMKILRTYAKANPTTEVVVYRGEVCQFVLNER